MTSTYGPGGNPGRSAPGRWHRAGGVRKPPALARTSTAHPRSMSCREREAHLRVPDTPLAVIRLRHITLLLRPDPGVGIAVRRPPRAGLAGHGPPACRPGRRPHGRDAVFKRRLTNPTQ